LVVVGQMENIDRMLTHVNLPRGSVMGNCSLSQNTLEEISIGHTNKAVKVFKGELSDEEVVSYIKILNKEHEKKGLSLILEDKEGMESSSKNLWIQLKEITGFQHGGLSIILDRVIKMESTDPVECRVKIFSMLERRYKKIYDYSCNEIGSYHSKNIGGSSQRAHFFVNFLRSASQSFLMRNAPPISDSHSEYWDYQFVVCEDLQKKSKKKIEGIPLTNPRAISKPVADAMYEVYLQM